MMLCPTLVTRQKHLFLISVFFVFKSYICDIHCNSFFLFSFFFFSVLGLLLQQHILFSKSVRML